MLLRKPGQLDVRLGIAGTADSPALEVCDRLIAPVLLDEEHCQGPLAGDMVWVAGQAEVVVLLGHLPVGGVAEDLCLLVVGGPQIVKTVGVAGLTGECLLEVVYGPEVVALLVELNTL